MWGITRSVAAITHPVSSSVFTDVKNVGKLAGILVGISLSVLSVVIIIWLVLRTKEKKKYEEEETPNEIRFAHRLFFWGCHYCAILTQSDW